MNRQDGDDLDDFQIPNEFLAISDGEGFDASQSEGQSDSEEAEVIETYSAGDLAAIEKKRKRREKEKQRKAKVRFISSF
jgi:protein CMS1